MARPLKAAPNVEAAGRLPVPARCAVALKLVPVCFGPSNVLADARADESDAGPSPSTCLVEKLLRALLRRSEAALLVPPRSARTCPQSPAALSHHDLRPNRD